MLLILKIFKRLAKILNIIVLRMDNSSQSNFHKEVNRWFLDEGDKTHRLNYDLDEQSLVIDLGGFEGQWTSDIYSKYRCSILVFEPYLPFAQKIENRFKKNSDIKIFKFGLGPRTETVGFLVSDNSSSICKEGSKNATVALVSAIYFINNNNIVSVDLMKINIEGAEYELLESIIDNGKVAIFKNIQVQFHDISDNALERMRSIQKKLSLTHELTYQYEFVWENWRLKEGNKT
jgi:FkbM family methyltransferase